MVHSKSHWHALIMAGGKGERFWPWSRGDRPKQLLPLLGKKTLIEMTVKRLLALLPPSQIWIVTSSRQARAMARLMPSFPKANFIVEPIGRDSAGAVMLGCATVARKDPEAVMALVPADQLIHDVRPYHRQLSDCFRKAAREDILMTIGTRPTAPSPSYGYIERGVEMKGGGVFRTRMFRVRRFVEKPDVPTARRLVKAGRFYWNAGMFIWSASAISRAFERHSPVHARGWRLLHKNRRGYLEKEFARLPRISIDYAVMEKARNIGVAEGEFGWDDLGSWSALYTQLPHDAAGNCVRGRALLVDSAGCMALGDGRMIAMLGVRDLVVIQEGGVTLVCHRDAARRLKELVKDLPSDLR